ncbi:hypothetical protein SORBI_3005G132300 [Sorghum bicolor]|uniref:Obtusifoliol 14-alpha demethylase n=1 Tax=Sorghum bicolor TaxID=4558 RepID=A0A1Z5RII0_SORBI|nr:hypothetical protein SORBI_3005G132300 [Sorghum bicolor]OQU83548.1 hypothetical protein SORBI_3005G132300 [Sorghum bicolor]
MAPTDRSTEMTVDMNQETASYPVGSQQRVIAGAALLVVSFAFIKILLQSGGSRGKRRRLPPTVRAPPLVGGLIRFARDPIPMIQEEYARLGSVFTVGILSRKITFLIGPEVSSHFFNGVDSEMSQNEVYQFTVSSFGPGVLYDVDYATRQEQFRFFGDAMHVSKLRGYVPLLVQEAEAYFSKWGESGTVDLKSEMERVVLVTASRCLLGREVREKLFDDVCALLRDVCVGIQPLSFLFPYLPTPAHRRRDRARARLGEIFSAIIKSRKASGHHSEEDDMLQCLIDSKYKNGRPTTEGEVTGLLIAVLFGGHQTTCITATWTGAYLLRFKHHFAAAVEEQTEVMKRRGDKIDYDAMAEMVLLHRCIKETLRLHPPLTMLLRQSHRDFTVTTKEGQEFDVPRSHMVVTSPAIANRLPDVYKDHESHGCLGQSFAYLDIKTIWAHLLRNFDLELVSPFPEKDRNTAFVGIKGEVMVKYKRRKLTVDVDVDG